VIVQALLDIDPHYPKVEPRTRQALQQARDRLEVEGPNEAAPEPEASSKTESSPATA
jgi:hypothetical protein